MVSPMTITVSYTELLVSLDPQCLLFMQGSAGRLSQICTIIRRDMTVDVDRKDREKVIARQEFVDELSLWNDTEDVKSSVLLPSKFFWQESSVLKSITVNVDFFHL